MNETFIERARRKQIVAATIDVIADEGFRAASVARIAERAGVSKSLVLYHFTTKDELLRQTVFDTYAALAEAVTSQLDFTRPVAETLPEAVRLTARVGIDQARSRRALDQIIANLGRSGTPQVLTPADADPITLGLQQMFEAGKADGSLRPDLDAHAMAVAYQAVINAMHTHLDAHPETDVDAFANALTDVLLRGAAR